MLSNWGQEMQIEAVTWQLETGYRRKPGLAIRLRVLGDKHNSPSTWTALAACYVIPVWEPHVYGQGAHIPAAIPGGGYLGWKNITPVFQSVCKDPNPDSVALEYSIYKNVDLLVARLGFTVPCSVAVFDARGPW